MTIREAEMVLGITSTSGEEDIQEAYEEAVFKQASFFMRRVFLPKLAEARIKRLEEISEAYAALNSFKQNFDKLTSIPIPSFENAQSIENLISQFNQFETSVRKNLANTDDANGAIQIFRFWKQGFFAYGEKFLTLSDSDGGNEKIKLSDAPIFLEFASSGEEKRSQLISRESARLKAILN